MGDVMQTRDLTVRRGAEVLFSGLNFELAAGQIIWLRGANGSGKTSLLRVLASLTTPDHGVVSWNGIPVQQSAAFRARLVYLGHTNGLKDDLSAIEALQFLTTLHGRRHGLPALRSALQRLGVAHRRALAIRLLSQGQRRRVALARLALEENPGVWILDEPFDALDDAGVALVEQLIQDNVRRGGAVLLTSHVALSPQPADQVPLTTLRLPGAAVA